MLLSKEDKGRPRTKNSLFPVRAIQKEKKQMLSVGESSSNWPIQLLPSVVLFVRLINIRTKTRSNLGRSELLVSALNKTQLNVNNSIFALPERFVSLFPVKTMQARSHTHERLSQAKASARKQSFKLRFILHFSPWVTGCPVSVKHSYENRSIKSISFKGAVSNKPALYHKPKKEGDEILSRQQIWGLHMLKKQCIEGKARLLQREASKWNRFHRGDKMELQNSLLQASQLH